MYPTTTWCHVEADTVPAATERSSLLPCLIAFTLQTVGRANEDELELERTVLTEAGPSGDQLRRQLHTGVHGQYTHHQDRH